MRPLPLFLLNEQISLRARTIAHQATNTCQGKLLPNQNDNHTPRCNKLKEQIEELALQVKLAGLQSKGRTNVEPPSLSLGHEEATHDPA